MHRLTTFLLTTTAAGVALIAAVALSTAMPRTGGQAREAGGSSPTRGAANPATVLRSLDLATDSRVGVCPGIADAANVLAAVEVARGADYRLAFPKMGRSPELETLATPVVMVIYSDGYPGSVWYAPNTPPEDREREPEPGTVDICAVMATAERVVYFDVPLEGFKVP